MHNLEEEEREFYYKFREALDSEGLSHISRSETLKLLNRHKYKKQKECMNHLKKNLKWKEENRVHEGNLDIVPYEQSTEALVLQGKDRFGRPLIILRPGLYKIGCTSVENFNTYSGIIIEQAIAQIPFNVDKYTLILDLENYSYDNIGFQTLYEAY